MSDNAPKRSDVGVRLLSVDDSTIALEGTMRWNDAAFFNS